MNPTEFGRFISEERAAKGMTQKELAEKLGVTDKAISKWERGVCLPDVAKFDDIAAALDLTDLEVLRAKRLPPETEKTDDKAPPFLTWRQAGRLLLWWVAMTVVLYIFDLRDMLGVSHIEPLGMVLLYFLPPAFAIPLAFRDARGVTRVDWRGVMRLWLIVIPVVFLLLLLQSEGSQPLYQFMDIPDRLLGLNSWEEQELYYGLPRGSIRWELRWQLFWFLKLRFFDENVLFSIAEAFGVYALAKRLRIRRNAKRQTNG